MFLVRAFLFVTVAFVVPLSFASCATATGQQSGPADVTAKGASISAGDDSLVSVSGQVLYQATWCRGTAPTARDLEVLQQIVPTSKRLLVRAGGENTGQSIYAEVLAHGPDGRFEVPLPAGQWCFVEEARRAPNASGQSGKFFDPACVLRHQQRCDGVVTVEPNTPISNLRLVYRDSCLTRHPCYRGPQPP